MKRGGYGTFYDDDQKLKRAHRVAWEIATSTQLTPGEHVLHRCDNPPCVRFEHLYLGDQSENMRDMLSKGRGVQQKAAVLDAQTVLLARQRYASGEKIRDITKDLGHHHALAAAITGKNWRHLPMPDCAGRPWSKPNRAPLPTVCSSGHEFNDENTGYKSSNGRKTRYCKQCNREKARAYVAKKRLAEGRTIGVGNATKTHCPSGHPYSPENTRVKATGWRDCKTCHRDAQRERSRRQRARA